MTILNTLKTAALATVVVLATAGASFAAQYAWVDHNSKVRQFHTNASAVVNWVEAGDQVKIIGSWNNWYKIKIPGQDGWVKAGVLEFNNWPNDPWPNGGNGQVCIGGPHGYFCIGN
jgi:uncharacterized protein YgiM (DUF1202 family)